MGWEYKPTARPIAAQFLWHGCMDDLITERSFDSQAKLVIDVLGLLFVMLSMVVCTNKHWQTSGRLVQELISRTVSTFFLKPYLALWRFYSRQHKNRTDCFISLTLFEYSMCYSNKHQIKRLRHTAFIWFGVLHQI